MESPPAEAVVPDVDVARDEAEELLEVEPRAAEPLRPVAPARSSTSTTLLPSPPSKRRNPLRITSLLPLNFEFVTPFRSPPAISPWNSPTLSSRSLYLSLQSCRVDAVKICTCGTHLPISATQPLCRASLRVELEQRPK